MKKKIIHKIIVELCSISLVWQEMDIFSDIETEIALPIFILLHLIFALLK